MRTIIVVVGESEKCVRPKEDAETRLSCLFFACIVRAPSSCFATLTRAKTWDVRRRVV